MADRAGGGGGGRAHGPRAANLELQGGGGAGHAHGPRAANLLGQGGGGAGRGHGPRAANPEVMQGGKGWPPKNENRNVEEDKMAISTSSPFKSEYTPIKVKNNELEVLYADLRVCCQVVKKAPSPEVLANSISEYKGLMLQINILRKSIMEDHKGLALPVPSKLRKFGKKLGNLYRDGN